MTENSSAVFRGGEGPEPGGAGIAMIGGGSSATVHDTIVANSPTKTLNNKNCAFFNSAMISSAGYNLEDADDCGFHETGDQTRTDPQLGALQDNGGPTFTMALSAGTPAVDAADPRCDAPTDQRGVARPQGTRCDIGAFELQVAASPSTLPSPPVTGQGARSDAPPAGLLVILVFALLAILGGLVARRASRAGPAG